MMPWWMRSPAYGLLGIAPAVVVFGADPRLWPQVAVTVSIIFALGAAASVELLLFIAGGR